MPPGVDGHAYIGFQKDAKGGENGRAGIANSTTKERAGSDQDCRVCIPGINLDLVNDKVLRIRALQNIRFACAQLSWRSWATRWRWSRALIAKPTQVLTPFRVREAPSFRVNISLGSTIRVLVILGLGKDINGQGRHPPC